MADVRLIDATALQNTISEWRKKEMENDNSITGPAIIDAFGDVLDAISVAPTIDPETLRPVAHWEESTCLDDSFWACSNCQFPSEAIAAPVLYHYCPHYGARMEDATNEQTEIS